MAKATSSSTSDKPKRRRRKKKAPAAPHKVERVETGARQLLTIDSADPVWQDLDGLKNAYPHEGAIVRLRPPHDATDEDVEAMKRALPDAAAIKVLPREASPAVVVATREKLPEMPPRRVVESMVEAANTKDRDALGELVGTVMDEEGL